MSGMGRRDAGRIAVGRAGFFNPAEVAAEPRTSGFRPYGPPRREDLYRPSTPTNLKVQKREDLTCRSRVGESLSRDSEAQTMTGGADEPTNNLNLHTERE